MALSRPFSCYHVNFQFYLLAGLSKEIPHAVRQKVLYFLKRGFYTFKGNSIADFINLLSQCWLLLKYAFVSLSNSVFSISEFTLNFSLANSSSIFFVEFFALCFIDFFHHLETSQFDFFLKQFHIHFKTSFAHCVDDTVCLDSYSLESFHKFTTNVGDN